MIRNTMDDEWPNLVHKCMRNGDVLAPRGKKILELQHTTIYINMNYPVLTNRQRNISYPLMAGEAHWILSGSDKLVDIIQYNKRMIDFSDNGVTLAGAYGPRIVRQLGYVVDKLIEDRDTRQATLSIWTPNPAATKDYPCTVAMDFKIRDKELNCHVFMRSSDIWLGLPYDVFAFSAVAWRVAASYNALQLTENMIVPGALCLTASSSHIYEPKWAEAMGIARDRRYLPAPVPACYWDGTMDTVKLLGTLRNTKPGDSLRWWEQTTIIEPNSP